MTGMIKKLTAGALALIVTVGLMLLPGCSLPELAMNIDDVSYTSGEYLAALFLTYDRYYSENVYTYSMYGMDFWEQEWEYGEDDDAVKLSINEYIKQHTIDELIRQTAVKKMMEDEQVTLSEESLKNLEEIGKTVNDSSTLRFGFNRNSYLKMYELLRMNEVDLLFGLYDKGGKRAVSEDEILKYYEDNYYSYKLIERPLFDGDNADLGAEEKAEVLDKLNGYLDAFNETGKTTKDFDAIIDRAKADYEAEQEADDDHDHDHDDDDQDDDDTAAGTTAEPTTTTTAEPTTTTTAEPTTTTTGKDGATDPNRRDVDIHMNSDNPDFVEKLKAAAVGEAVVVEYKKDDGYGETLPYAGVLLRLDPAADRGEKDGEPINYYEESRRSIIYGARNEEFEEDLKKWIDPCKDKAEINLTVQQQCNPKKLFA